MNNLTYTQRATDCPSIMGKHLLKLMDDKQTNLALSADVTSAEQLLKLADLLGPDICMLKTHIDIINDFSADLTEKLLALANKHQFILFEDRKFADIGNTVMHQYQGGMYQISKWAHVVNAHSLPGPGLINGLMQANTEKNRGLILIAEMSSAGNLLRDNYIQETLNLAEQFPQYVIGFISQRALTNNPNWIYMTPGVKLTVGMDTLGQQYVTPQQAILKNGTDIIIVGRGIIAAPDPLAETKRYRATAWTSYQERCG